MWKTTIILVTIFSLVNANPPQAQPKIVGGSPAKTQYTYMASLQLRVNVTRRNPIPLIGILLPSGPPEERWSHFCGGSIITTRTILTAAHCVNDITMVQRISIVVGTSNLTNQDNGYRYLVDRTVVHEQYKELQQNDIALVIVKQAIEYGPNVQPVEIANERAPPGSSVLLIGWGYTTMVRGLFGTPDQLREIILKIYPLSECRDAGMPPSDNDTCTEGHLFKGACGVRFVIN